MKGPRSIKSRSTITSSFKQQRKFFILDRMIALVCSVTIAIAMSNGGRDSMVHGYPSLLASLEQKLENKLASASAGDNSVTDPSFHQFIQSKPESLIIGELKPNASEMDVEDLRSKIATTILGMQLVERSHKGEISLEPTGADCFIGVTRVERVPGKCHKVQNNIPICQAADYVAISSDCK